MDIDETTSGRTFNVQMTEREISAYERLLMAYARRGHESAFQNMRGHALTQHDAAALSTKIAAVLGR